MNAASYAPGAVAPGEIVTIFGERLGPAGIVSAGFDPSGRLETSAGVTRVLFDGIPAPVLYAGGSQGMVAGVMQVNVRVPAPVEPSSAAAVVIRAGAAESPPLHVAVK